MRLIESASKDVLARYGLKAPDGRLCTTPEQASAAARELGGPVYIKAQIPFGDRATLGLVGRVGDPDAAAAATAQYLQRTVDGMKVGGRRQVDIPFADAFGEAGNTNLGLPASTDLIMILDLVAVY